MICGKTLKDKMKSKLILKMSGVETLKEILRSLRLRWFGHITRMSKEKGKVLAVTITMKSNKNGRPKKRWTEVVEESCDKRLRKGKSGSADENPTQHGKHVKPLSLKLK